MPYRACPQKKLKLEECEEAHDDHLTRFDLEAEITARIDVEHALAVQRDINEGYFQKIQELSNMASDYHTPSMEANILELELSIAKNRLARLEENARGDESF